MRNCEHSSEFTSKAGFHYETAFTTHAQIRLSQSEIYQTNETDITKRITSVNSNLRMVVDSQKSYSTSEITENSRWTILCAYVIQAVNK